MPDEQPILPSTDFEAMASTIVQKSPSLPAGRDALLEAYNSAQWDNQDNVLQSLQDYGEALPHKFQELPSVGGDILERAPVTVSDVYTAGRSIETDDDGNPKTDQYGRVIRGEFKGNDNDLWNQWEAANLKYINEAKDPEVLVAKNAYINEVKAYASKKRQESYVRAKESNTSGVPGLGVLTDAFGNVASGLFSPLAPAINAVANRFDPEFDFNQYLTEHSDPAITEKIGSKLVSAASSAVGTVASISSGGIAGLGLYQGPAAISKIRQRYNKTLENTGSPSAAKLAATIEAESQGLQLGASAFGFGKVAAAIGKPVTSLAAQVAEAAGTQFTAGVVGTAASNVAENIQEIRPIGEDIGRNVVETALINSVVAAGAAGAVPFLKTSKGPTAARKADVDEFGKPLTPNTIQKVGPIPSEKPSLTKQVFDSEPTGEQVVATPKVEDTQPGARPNAKVEFAVTPDGEVVSAQPIQDAPVPIFKLEDGSTYIQDGGNLRRQHTDGKIDLPFQKSIPISESDAAIVAEAVTSGDAQVTFDGEGKPVLKSTDGKDTILHELTPTLGSKGDYILDLSPEVQPNKQQILRPLRLSPKIVEVNQSMGAATTVRMPQTFVEGTFSQRARFTPGLPPSLETIGKAGIFHKKFDFDAAHREAEALFNHNREGVIDAILKTPEGTPLRPEHQVIGISVLNKLMKEYDVANDTGQSDLAIHINNVIGQLAPKVSTTFTTAGQTLYATKGLNFTKLGDIGVVESNRSNEYSRAVKEHAASEGVDPSEVLNHAPIEQRITDTQQALVDEAAVHDAPIKAEEAKVNEIVTELENKGKKIADEQNTSIEKEIKDLKEDVAGGKGGKHEEARLERLQHIPKLTPEGALTKPERAKLKKYKDMRDDLIERRTNNANKSDRYRELEKELKELQSKKEKVAKVQKQARKQADKKAQEVAARRTQAQKLQEIADTIPDTGRKRMAEMRIAEMRAADLPPTNPAIGEQVKRTWIVNAVSGLTNLAKIITTTPLGMFAKAGGAGLLESHYLIKRAMRGTNYRSPFTEMMVGFLNPANYARGIKLGYHGLREGIAFGSDVKAKEVQYKNPLSLEMPEYIRELTEHDAVNASRKFHFELLKKNGVYEKTFGTAGRALGIALIKGGGLTAGYVYRMIPFIDNVFRVPMYDGFQRQAAATRYNQSLEGKLNKTNEEAVIADYVADLVDRQIAKMPEAERSTVSETQVSRLRKEALDKITDKERKSIIDALPESERKTLTEAQLKEYMYDTKEQRARANKFAAEKAKDFRDNGLKFTKRDEMFLAEEVYQTLLPRDVNLYAQKLTGQINQNIAASGVTGLASQIIQSVIHGIAVSKIPGINAAGSQLEILVPFANNIAQAMGQAIELSPFGLAAGAQTSKNANRIDLERHMAMASSVVASATVGALAYWWHEEQKKKPEDRLFDVRATGSGSKEANDLYHQSGGGDWEFLIANKWHIPIAESPFVLALAPFFAYADMTKDGKKPDIGVMGLLTLAAFSYATSLGKISMMRGLENITDAIGIGAKDSEKGSIMLTRALLNIGKNYIPANGLLRTVSRYMEHPVDAKNDLQSAVVEGLTVIPGMNGLPALNMFGEPLPSAYEMFPGAMYRIYSTANGDLDMRWLSNNGYTIPGIKGIKLDAGEKDDTGIEDPLSKIEYKTRREILKLAGPEMRSTVADYRKTYSYSAPDPQVQKDLRRDINRILSDATVEVINRQGGKH